VSALPLPRPDDNSFLGVARSATGKIWRDRLDARGAAHALAIAQRHAMPELLARVRSLLRRGPARPQEVIRMADLEIDLLRQRAIRGGQRLDLTSKEFSMLTLLARHAGEVLSRTLIAEAVWDMNFDSDTNVVDVNIRRLRAKVDEPFPLKLIHTVRGAGYVMECDQ